MASWLTGLFEGTAEPGGVVLFLRFMLCVVMGELNTKAEAYPGGGAGGGLIGWCCGPCVMAVLTPKINGLETQPMAFKDSRPSHARAHASRPKSTAMPSRDQVACAPPGPRRNVMCGHERAASAPVSLLAVLRRPANSTQRFGRGLIGERSVPTSRGRAQARQKQSSRGVR